MENIMRQPTKKQRIASIEILNGTPVVQALKKAGYSDSTASSTTSVTRSTGFQKMMAYEALKAGKLTTALMAKLQERILSDEVDNMTIKDLVSVTEKVVKIVDTIAENAGIKHKPTERSANTIDIDVTEIEY